MQQKNTALLTIIGFAALLLASCTSSKNSIDVQQAKIAEFKREEYVLLDQVTADANSLRLWLLFIPIGGKSDQRLHDEAYQSAVKQIPEADGLIKPRFEYKKTSVPLILIGFTHKKVSVTGKGYRLKGENEMKGSVVTPKESVVAANIPTQEQTSATSDANTISTPSQERVNVSKTNLNSSTVSKSVKFKKGQTVKFKRHGDLHEGEIDSINEEKKLALIIYEVNIFGSIKKRIAEVPFAEIFN
jgi:hypothetical protein